MPSASATTSRCGRTHPSLHVDSCARSQHYPNPLKRITLKRWRFTRRHIATARLTTTSDTAWDNALAFHDIDTDHEPTKSLCIGPDNASNLLELLYLQLPDNDLIIHAMPLRTVFRTYLTGEES